MFLGKTLRVGFALLGLTMAGACAHPEGDKKPELAQSQGYYVDQKDAEARGGVSNYVTVPSNSEKAQQDEQHQQAGIAQQPAPPAPEPAKSNTVPALENQDKIILFELGDSRIHQESTSTLDQIAKQLKDAGDVTVKVEGFADKIGSPASNMALSKERADCVRKYLESKGAPSDKLEVASFGDEKATNPNGNPDERKVVLSLG